VNYRILLKILSRGAAAYSLWLVISFLVNLNLRTESLPLVMRIFIVLSLAFIVGGGISINFKLTETSDIKYSRAALIYSALFFIAQIIFLVAPAYGSCNCLSIRDTIMNITDWSRINLAASAVFCHGLVFYTYRITGA